MTPCPPPPPPPIVVQEGAPSMVVPADTFRFHVELGAQRDVAVACLLHEQARHQQTVADLRDLQLDAAELAAQLHLADTRATEWKRVARGRPSWLVVGLVGAAGVVVGAGGIVYLRR